MKRLTAVIMTSCMFTFHLSAQSLHLHPSSQVSLLASLTYNRIILTNIICFSCHDLDVSAIICECYI